MKLLGKWVNERNVLYLALKSSFNDTVCKLLKKIYSAHGAYRKIVDFVQGDKKYLFFPPRPARNLFLFVFSKRNHRIIANGLDSDFALR